MTTVSTRTGPAYQQRLPVQRFGRNPGAELVLYCFPHAGGNGAAYQPWTALVPGTVDVRSVRLPGRPGHLEDDPFTDLRGLAAALAGVVAQDAAGTPFVLFGHSMGALLAFEVARELRRSHAPQPLRLALSGTSAAHRRTPLAPVHTLGDDELVAAVSALGGLPDEVAACPELLELLLPSLRADFAMVHGYRYEEQAPLAVPFSVFGGSDDERVPAADLGGWAELTSARCSVRTHPGGHFYLGEFAADVVAGILTDLGSAQ
ncbi:thioesterase II family protein [Streptomyces sp. NPDC001594]|uniref:thioesterase II family protein n=1 Tax=Streptomyces sp. NPDC001594 TaxID=3364590 RepID=UPI0036C86256